MKKIVMVTVLGIFLISCATMMGEKAAPEMRKYENVGDVPGVLKDDLYVKVNSWFVETFKSAESVIEYQDKEAGKVMGKYVFNYSEGAYSYSVKQTISIDVKDGKYRLVITNPYFLPTGDVLGGTYAAPGDYRILDTVAGITKAQSEWKKLEQSLVAYLNTSSDW